MVCQVAVFMTKGCIPHLLCVAEFHTPRDPRARPLVDGESREPSERFSGRLFPFLIGTERRPSAAVGFREGRRRLRIWSFRRPGGSGMEQASSDAAAVLFFLRKEKEKNGGAKKRRRAFAHLTIPPSFASQMPPPFTQGRLCPLRRGWADEGIGPYKPLSGAARQLPQGEPFWAALPIRSP